MDVFSKALAWTNEKMWTEMENTEGWEDLGDKLKNYENITSQLSKKHLLSKQSDKMSGV